MDRNTALSVIARACREIASAIDALASEPNAPPDVYTTRGPLPPGRSARWLREHAREMGGTRTGGARGRTVLWSVQREAYERWVASRAGRRNEPSEGTQRADVVDLERWIQASGYRPTRRT